MALSIKGERIRYFQYFFLPLGLSRSDNRFTRLVSRFWMAVKSRLGYRVLTFFGDFGTAPARCRSSTKKDCRPAPRVVDTWLMKYELTRHPSKGIWGEMAWCLVRLGFLIDTVRGNFGIPAEKMENITSLANDLLTMVWRNRRSVPGDILFSFIGKAQSLRLAFPETAFKLRSRYNCFPTRRA